MKTNMKQLQIDFQTTDKACIIQCVSNSISIPDGFTTLLVKEIPNRTGDRRNENICNFCDARKLCIENKDNWCQKYRCMTYDVKKPDGTIIKGREKQVVFKRLS